MANTAVASVARPTTRAMIDSGVSAAVCAAVKLWLEGGDGTPREIFADAVLRLVAGHGERVSTSWEVHSVN